MTLTDKEKTVLTAFLDSAYGNEHGRDDRETWLWEISNISGIKGKEYSGVISSLTKKDLVNSWDYEENGSYDGWVICLTDKGIKTLQSLEAEEKEVNPIDLQIEDLQGRLNHHAVGAKKSIQCLQDKVSELSGLNHPKDIESCLSFIDAYLNKVKHDNNISLDYFIRIDQCLKIKKILNK